MENEFRLTPKIVFQKNCRFKYIHAEQGFFFAHLIKLNTRSHAELVPGRQNINSLISFRFGIWKRNVVFSHMPVDLQPSICRRDSFSIPLVCCIFNEIVYNHNFVVEIIVNYFGFHTNKIVVRKHSCYVCSFHSRFQEDPFGSLRIKSSTHQHIPWPLNKHPQSDF